MRACPACDGFVPAHLRACPHCSVTVSCTVTVVRWIAAAGAWLTLMACYGAMPYPHDYAQQGCADGDGDGACAEQDCNDGERSVYPGAADPDLDGVDQNCDGVDGWRDPATVAAPP